MVGHTLREVKGYRRRVVGGGQYASGAQTVQAVGSVSARGRCGNSKTIVMIKKEKPMMSVSAIIQSHWGRGLSLENNLSLVGPQSPLDMKPDAASLLAGSFSPSQASNPTSPAGYGMTHPTVLGNGNKNLNTPYPPNHPLSGSKHLCSICGDRASGKHYGVYRAIQHRHVKDLSWKMKCQQRVECRVLKGENIGKTRQYPISSCEGCKGFFKRTVRKDLSYACREDKQCLVDKRQRNRCQYCRYQKCLSMGMKREAVQEERQRTKERDQNEVESTSSFHTDMPVERILEAERRVDFKVEPLVEYQNPNILSQATDKQLVQLVEWAKQIPHFASLPVEDQVLLLRAGWNELLIAGFSHRSVGVKDKIVLGSGVMVGRDTAHHAGVDTIFDRALTELVSKMREMKMDKAELGCLRTIILYNPEVRGLKSVGEVEALREKVYASLEEYTRSTHPEEPGRFAKLLLRLPSLRSIGLKCLEPLFFYRVLHDIPIETFLLQMLESSDMSNRL